MLSPAQVGVNEGSRHGQSLFIGSRYSSRSENPGGPPRHSRRNGNPEPLLCVMKVVPRETRWVRCRRPPAEYLLPRPCRRIVRALDSRCGENDGRKMKRPCRHGRSGNGPGRLPGGRHYPRGTRRMASGGMVTETWSPASGPPRSGLCRQVREPWPTRTTISISPAWKRRLSTTPSRLRHPAGPFCRAGPRTIRLSSISAKTSSPPWMAKASGSLAPSIPSGALEAGPAVPCPRPFR